MREVWRAHPDDADVGALTAEALMDLHPWDLFTSDGKAKPHTPEILAVLEAVMAKRPDHPLANHLYIHAVESSSDPGKGLPSADRLRTLVPGACENGYKEAIVFADVDLPEGPMAAPVDPVRATPPRWTPSVLASGTETTPVPQSAPRIAALRKRVWVVWHDERAGLPNVWLAFANDREPLAFGEPIRVSDNPAGTVAELHPTIAVRNKRLVVAWQVFEGNQLAHVVHGVLDWSPEN